MDGNRIYGQNLHLSKGRVVQSTQGNLFDIVLADEYLKTLQYQKVLRARKQFYLSGDLLYTLLGELMKHINGIFLRIRINDVDVDQESRTMIFLRKFSRSSEIIKDKLEQVTPDSGKASEKEVFLFQISGLEKDSSFRKDSNGNQRMVLHVPVTYTFNRLISFLDRMTFSQISGINSDIRQNFLNGTQDLLRNVEEKRHQIDMKYALELATYRIRSLENENLYFQQRLDNLKMQNELFRRSYFSLKNRRKDKKKEETLEEL